MSLDTLKLKSALEAKIKTILENEILTDVRVSENYEKPPLIFTVVQATISGFDDKLYRLPSGKHEYLMFNVSLNIIHYVHHSQYNAGKMETMKAKTLNTFRYSRAKEVFTHVLMDPYKLEAIGAPGPIDDHEHDEERKHDVAEMSFSLKFSINPDAVD